MPELQPIEAYIESCRKQGYSCEEILRELQRKGYAEDVIALADKAYHYRRTIRVLSFVLAVSVIAGIVAVMWNPLGFLTQPTRVVQGHQEVLQQANQCMMIQNRDQRVICISRLESMLENEEIQSIGLSDPLYPVVAEQMGLRAAIRNDASLCQSLAPAFREGCSQAVPFLHAVLMGDPEACGAVPDLDSRNACVTNAVMSLDPVQGQHLLEEQARVMLTAVQNADESLCQGLPYEVWKKDCAITVKTHKAIQTRSKEGCEAVPDPALQILCLDAVRAQIMVPG